MKITIPVNLIAADTDARTISGRIVTWGETGNTSAGKTVFAKDSIALKPVKLFIDHNMDKPIGKVLDFDAHDEGIDATFKIANTQRGNDALVEAMEGLKDGFSVGIKLSEYDNTDEGLVVKNSQLIEVSLVETPAIDSARVSEVAASDDPQDEQEGSDMTETPELQTEVSVEAAKVEAPAIKASTPVFTSPRVDTNVTAGQYALAQIKAQRGDADARDLVAALDVATTSENIGVVPPTYLRDLIGIIDNSMPFADSLEQGVLPATGMKFYRPVIGVQATTAVTAEGVELDSTDTTITSMEIDVVKIGGANIINAELVERSDPSYVDVLLRELAASWAQKADVYAASIALGAPGSSSGTTLYKAIADGIADAYAILRKTPNRFLADTGNFAELLGEVDGSQRPLFAAAAPQNAAGLMTQGSTQGTIAGLQLVVDPNFDTGTGVKGVVYSSDAATFYRGGAIQVRSQVVANAQLEIGLYGYVACARKYGSSFRNLTVA